MLIDSELKIGVNPLPSGGIESISSIKSLISRPYGRRRRGGGRWRMSYSGGLNIGGSVINAYPRLGY